MVHNYHSLWIDATIYKNCPITGEHVGIIFVAQWVTKSWNVLETVLSHLQKIYLQTLKTLFDLFSNAFATFVSVFGNVIKHCLWYLRKYIKHERQCFIGISKHREESWKYDAQRSIFEEISRWTISWVCDMSSQSNQKLQSKRISKIIKIYAY